MGERRGWWCLALLWLVDVAVGLVPTPRGLRGPQAGRAVWRLNDRGGVVRSVLGLPERTEVAKAGDGEAELKLDGVHADLARHNVSLREVQELEKSVRGAAATPPPNHPHGGGMQHASSRHEAVAAAAAAAASGGAAVLNDPVVMADSVLAEGVNSKVLMDRLKSQPVHDEVGAVLRSINPKLLRIWTKADFLHAHAISGVVFLLLGTMWQLARVGEIFQHPPLEASPLGDVAAMSPWLAADSPLSLIFILAGLVNGITAIPMSQFNSNKMFDLSDLKGNGFALGGTGLTTMCLWMSWWFSGSYPDFMHGVDVPLVLFFSALCVATTVNWEVMLQQNFGSGDQEHSKSKKKGRQDRKLAGATKEITAEALQTKKWLYRVASWPNLTQILFMSSIALGGSAWLNDVQSVYPGQPRMLFDYSFASALGYSFSMFAETLRDRKLISLEVDFICLMLGVVAPMGIVVADTVASAGSIQINPAAYWYIFGNL